MKKPTALQVIEKLGLEPLRGAGGYYRETYRSSLSVPGSTGEPRAAGTAILFMLTPESRTAIHRVAHDEILHFYLGDPIELLQLRSDGTHELGVMGSDILAGHRSQV